MAEGALAGRAVQAGRVPDVLARTSAVANVSFTSEASVMTATAYLIEGRTYKVKFHGRFHSNVATDRVVVRLRETNVSGMQHTEHNVLILSGLDTGFPDWSEYEHVADADGDQVFAVTAQRIGTGTTQLRAGSDRPATLSIEYLRG